MPPRKTPSTIAILLLVLTAGAGLLTPGCVTSPQLVRADGTPDGKAIYEQRCAQCHTLYRPEDYSDEEWAENVHHYASRAGVHPSWRPAVIAYLQGANDGGRHGS